MTDLELKAADDCAQDLLNLYESLKVQAIVIALVNGVILVRCQESEDVVPLCQHVLSELKSPDGRTLN